METIVIGDDIRIPSDRGIALYSGPSKKLNIISGNANKLRLAADKTKNNYKKKQTPKYFKSKK